MYLLQFSRYDCPGCNKMWCFSTIEELESFVRDACPKFPETTWKPRNGFYPNGLSISEVVGRKQVLRMRSMVDAHDFEHEMPECFCAEVEPVAKLIYEAQGIVDIIDDEGEYRWPLDQIPPRVDKEDLVKTVFHPTRISRMGGTDWLECV
jgi:hypothetical protein